MLTLKVPATGNPEPVIRAPAPAHNIKRNGKSARAYFT
jgi:hypothetical protein